jgi:protein-S-isoprenylcysteine O-methyltransferase Ste14
MAVLLDKEWYLKKATGASIRRLSGLRYVVCWCVCFVLADNNCRASAPCWLVPPQVLRVFGMCSACVVAYSIHIPGLCLWSVIKSQKDNQAGSLWWFAAV